MINKLTTGCGLFIAAFHVLELALSSAGVVAFIGYITAVFWTMYFLLFLYEA